MFREGEVPLGSSRRVRRKNLGIANIVLGLSLVVFAAYPGHTLYVWHFSVGTLLAANGVYTVWRSR